MKYTKDIMTISNISLIEVIARLIKQNNLHESNREDTIGILMRCGAFKCLPANTGVVDLSTLIDQQLQQLQSL